MLHSAVRILVLACLLSWANLASAAPRKLTIELQTSVRQAPSHVCLLASTQEPKTAGQSAHLRHLVTSGVCRGSGSEFVCDAKPIKAEGQECSALASAARCPDDAEARKKLCAGGDAGPDDAHCCGKGDVSLCPRDQQVLDSLCRSGKRSGQTDLCCGGVGSALDSLKCAPEEKQALATPEVQSLCENRTFPFHSAQLADGRLFCAPNVAGNASPRVLVLNLYAPYSTMPAVQKLEVNGTAVVVTVEEPQSEAMALAVNVAGGDYIEGGPVFVAERTTRLPLTPRCGVHTLQVAGGQLAKPPEPEKGKPPPAPLGTLTFNSPVRSYSYPLSTEFNEVLLPYSIEPGTRTLTVQTATSQFETRWEGAEVDATLKLLAKHIQLVWHPHCAFPAKGRCPTVSLPDAGARCEPEHGWPWGHTPDPHGECVYTCKTNDLVGFDLPQRASFVHHHGEGFVERWSDRAFSDGETLNGYTVPSERHVRITIEDLPTDNPSELFSLQDKRIDFLEVRGPDGKRFRVKPEAGSARLHIPGLSCRDYLSFRYVGRRTYFETTARTLNGQVRIAPPSSTLDDPVGFAAIASVGPSYGPLGFAGAQEFSVFLAAEGQLVVRYMKPTSHYWPHLGLRVGTLRVSHPHLARVSLGEDEYLEPVTAHHSLIAVPLRLGLLFDFGRSSTFEVAAGGFLAFPESNEHQDSTPWQVGPTASVHIINYPSAWPVGFEFGVHVLPVTTLLLESELRGDPPTISEKPAWYVLPSIGLRLGR